MQIFKSSPFSKMYGKLKNILRFIFKYECFAWMYECVSHVWLVPTEARRGHWISGNWSSDGCEPSSRSWELNPGPLEEHAQLTPMHISSRYAEPVRFSSIQRLLRSQNLSSPHLPAFLHFLCTNSFQTKQPTRKLWNLLHQPVGKRHSPLDLDGTSWIFCLRTCSFYLCQKGSLVMLSGFLKPWTYF